MSLHELLLKKEAEKQPIRVGIIGAGRYGAMYLAQSRFIPGIQIAGIADLDLSKARGSILKAGYAEEALGKANSAGEVSDLAKQGKTALTENSANLIEADLDVIVEITGTVNAAALHAWNAMDAGKHVVMVSTEADCLLGVALQAKAQEKGVVYSFGYGDEPAEMCEMIDWARTSGFEVACVGKYIEYIPEKRYVNPSTVWDYKKNYTKEQIESGELNAKLFSSFVDGTKTLTEACCAANAAELIPRSGGITFPTVDYDEMVTKFRPASEGGILERCGTVEVPSNFYPDGTQVKRHLRWGVFISVRAQSEYAASFLTDFRNENRMIVDDKGNYGIMYRPTHILGLEVNKSIASVALTGVPTGCPKKFCADMVNVAKKDLKPGDMLDGPGAYTTYGQLVPAEESMKNNYLPTGFSEKVKVIRPVAKDAILTYDDVEIDENMFSYKLRKDIEAGRY